MVKLAVIDGLSISKALVEGLAALEIEFVDSKDVINTDNEFVIKASDLSVARGFPESFNLGYQGGKQKAQWKQETSGLKRK
jgi:hypothetical protein